MLSITGIVVVGVLIELLLTDSIMSKFIRAVYAFFILFVIVSPLPAFFSGDFDWNNQLEYDWGLINTINTNSSQAAQARVERALEQSNISGTIVTITSERDNPAFRVDQVFVNAWNAQYTGSRVNINLQAEIIRIVRASLNVTEEQIVVTM